MCMRAPDVSRGRLAPGNLGNLVAKKTANPVTLEAEVVELRSVTEFIYSRGAEVTSPTRGGVGGGSTNKSDFFDGGEGSADFFKIGCNTPSGGHVNDVMP